VSEDYLTVLLEALAYARERDYVGWDKHDGMSSRIRRALPVETKWTNLAFQETVKRAPVNLRPLFLVEQRPSPKGLSLFSMAALNAAGLTDAGDFGSEARSLLDRVLSHDLAEYDGFCLSHNHELQGLKRKKPLGNPGVVATSFGVKALLRGADLDPSYPGRARTVTEYVESELSPDRSGVGTRLDYKPTDDAEVYTVNANAIAARMFVDLYAHFGDDSYRDTAEQILTYVASRQDDSGGWYYTDPPSASHISMDNYHNGFIVESFLRYREVVDGRAFEQTVDRALSFYRHTLYEDDGAPCWDETKAYPRDVHAAAQGVVTFSHAGRHEFAERVLEWTLENLHAGDGRFYYQKRKHFTKRFTLMRWCQAWMSFALSEFLVTSPEHQVPLARA
jgi:hypothetical protein